MSENQWDNLVGHLHTTNKMKERYVIANTRCKIQIVVK
jgi:hypothetical protein